MSQLTTLPPQMVMNAYVNMDGAFYDINEGRVGMGECMGEWEFLQAEINGPKEKKTTKYHAWVLLGNQFPCFMEWERTKD